MQSDISQSNWKKHFKVHFVEFRDYFAILLNSSLYSILSASILPSRGWDVKCQIFNEILCSPKAYIINNTYVGALKILFILEIYMSTPSLDCMYYVE